MLDSFYWISLHFSVYSCNTRISMPVHLSLDIILFKLESGFSRNFEHSSVNFMLIEQFYFILFHLQVINISEPRDDLQRANNQKVIDFGWPENLAPPLERLCNICKSLDSWLNSDLSHVIVLHCKGGRGRLAVIIAAFLNYSNICSRLVKGHL